MSNEIGRKLAVQKMRDSIERIKKLCDSFSDESEYFLCPMYILVASAMDDVIYDIGRVLVGNDTMTGGDALKLMVDAFTRHTEKLSEGIDRIQRENNESQEKSHNEQLTERLLKEAGIQ